VLTRRLLAIGLVVIAGCGRSEPQWTPPPAPKIDDPSLIPVPIGPTRAYQPDARAPSGTCTPGPVRGRYRAHIELFAHQHAVVIPAGIGLRAPRENDLGRIDAAACRAALRTLDPTGVVEFDRADLTLRDVFAIWRQPFGADRLLTFRGDVALFLAGRRVRGDVALTDGAQIVVEVGGSIPPHPSFTFPARG
jgi:hypothetical protein